MKTIHYSAKLFVLAIITVFLSSCFDSNNQDINNNLNFANFDFKTTKQIEVELTALNAVNKPIEGVYVEMYTQNPLKEDGTLNEHGVDFLIFKGITDVNGVLACEISPATTVDSLYFLTNYVGLPDMQKVKITTQELKVLIGGNSSKANSTQQRANSVVGFPKPKKTGNFYVLGKWDADGAPDYLWAANDVIDQQFLDDINASLPERLKLTDSHPEYIESTDEGSIVLIEDAEVWVTFVHEGAGYKNTLGYYTHANDNSPATKSDIKDATVIFPNVSYLGSGGKLVSGNKVQLLYLNKQTNTYSNIFPAGTTIAWFYIANAFNYGNISSSNPTYYSDKRFNPEADENKRKHNVILKDNARRLLLIGFEDLNRGSDSDEDFNDGVFYSTITPYTAVKEDIYRPIDTNKDTDGDGVGDTRDEYPNDPTKAFNNYYPSVNQVGTLAFEDLWPIKGDYDFNDLVIDYKFNQIANSANKVVQIDIEYTVRAIGALYRNPFAFSLNTTPGNIKAVTGQTLKRNIFKMNSNGTEMNQSNAVIPVFDDPYQVLDYSGTIVNTIIGGAYAEPKSLKISVELNNPLTLSELGLPPYNPFIVVSGDRAKEVHLPGGAPTDLVDTSIFGTADDNTSISDKKYYMSDKYLPWAINIPVQFDYPAENQDITKSYLMFNNWGSSRGYNYMDWYTQKNGYRDESKFFKK